MATKTSETALTRTAHISRKGIKYVVLGLILFLAARMAVNAFVTYWKATHPAPPPPPTVGFGVLPKIRFPEADDAQPKEYVLETANGTFPTFSDRAVVFLMPKNPPNLLDHQNALKKAAGLGFVFEPAILDERTYRFTLTDPLISTLDLDIQDGTFLLQTDYSNRPDLLLKTSPPTKFDAVSSVKKFLTSAGALTPDVATSSGDVRYLKSEGVELVPAVAPSDAQFVEVNLNRPPILAKYPAYTSEGKTGVIKAILVPLQGRSDTIAYLRNAYYPIDEQLIHTYPLRPIREAWNALQNGDGYIASGKNQEKAVIREVSLGYYEDLEGQMYLQPVYVFSGDNNFIAYVPAITAQYQANQVAQPMDAGTQ